MKRLVTVLVGATVLAGLTSSIDALTTDYQAAVSIPQLEARCRTRDVQACNAHRAAVLAKFKAGKTSPATNDTPRECDAVSTGACRALALKAQTAKDRERALHLYGRNCFRRDLDSCGEPWGDVVGRRGTTVRQGRTRLSRRGVRRRKCSALLRARVAI